MFKSVFCIKFFFLIHVSVQDKEADVCFPAVYISGVHFSMGIGAEFTERSRNDEHSEERENEVYRSEQAVIGQNPNVDLIKILTFSILIFYCYTNCIHFVYIACIIN